jgi:hypothetical protein
MKYLSIFLILLVAKDSFRVTTKMFKDQNELAETLQKRELKQNQKQQSHLKEKRKKSRRQRYPLLTLCKVTSPIIYQKETLVESTLSVSCRKSISSHAWVIQWILIIVNVPKQ